MKRVVITGMGIVSCLGNDLLTVTNALKTGKSGISRREEYEQFGFRSQIAGIIDIDLHDHIDRKNLRFMGNSAAYTCIAMKKALEDANLPDSMRSHERTGLIAASGGASSDNIVEACDIIRTKGIKKIGPYRVPRTMGSTVSACLATTFAIKGINYSITSACSTSAHCIGNAFEQIQMGKQDIIFAGGGDGEHWSQTAMFDAMGALSSKYNDTPEKASRPYDQTRDGFVISSGGGMLVLEELEHAKARGAKIYAEIVGYGATSDGYDMVAPSGEGAVRCMKQALSTVQGPIDYINTHGTSTPVGDIKELEGIRAVFGDNVPLISSTKSLSGHSLGGAGAHEAIFSLLMMQEGFLTGSANIDNVDPAAADMPVIQNKAIDKKIDRVLSNSFGFGGTNACLVFERFND